MGADNGWARVVKHRKWTIPGALELAEHPEWARVASVSERARVAETESERSWLNDSADAMD